MIYLETERLVLRRFSEADIDHLVDLDSDPAVTRYINGGKPTSREFVVQQVMPRILSYYADLVDQGIWAAIDKESHDFIGWFHLRPNRTNPAETELGYRLKHKYWGQGIATEGSQALLKKGFKELGVDIAVAIADPNNFASIRVMEKVGMSYLGEFKEADDFLVVKYGLTAAVYFAQND